VLNVTPDYLASFLAELRHAAATEAIDQALVLEA
jgi:hypothetical protein